MRKVIQANYLVKSAGPACGDTTIQTAAECWEAAARLLPNATLTTATVSNSSLPSGCSVERAPSGDVAVTFNKLDEGATTCGGASSTVSGTTKSLVQLHLSMDKASDEVRITIKGPANVWFGEHAMTTCLRVSRFWSDRPPSLFRRRIQRI